MPSRDPALPLIPDDTRTPTPPAPKRRSRFRDRDGVTAAERALPPSDDPSLQALEQTFAEHARAQEPNQLTIPLATDDGELTPEITTLAPLDAGSSLELARTWFRRELELAHRPRNTIHSYSYDLQVLEEMIGPKPLTKIDRRDVAQFLSEASSKTTRKRRLTSLRQFFHYLIVTAKVLRFDPTEGYYPHPIQLRAPMPLFPDEQDALLAAARRDEPWSATAIWLMMRLGLTRSELLALRRDHIDRVSEDVPVVYIAYEDPAKQAKDRHLRTDATFTTLYEDYLAKRDVADRLFPVGPPAINGMVERVRRDAGITKEVSPQTLRHTFAVEQAKAGADVPTLLAMLGLADDARNRESVRRYIELAKPALAPATSPSPSTESPDA